MLASDLAARLSVVVSGVIGIGTLLLGVWAAVRASRAARTTDLDTAVSIWKETVAELRTEVVDLRAKVAECERRDGERVREVEALRERVSVLESGLTGRRR